MRVFVFLFLLLVVGIVCVLAHETKTITIKAGKKQGIMLYKRGYVSYTVTSTVPISVLIGSQNCMELLSSCIYFDSSRFIDTTQCSMPKISYNEDTIRVFLIENNNFLSNAVVTYTLDSVEYSMFDWMTRIDIISLILYGFVVAVVVTVIVGLFYYVRGLYRTCKELSTTTLILKDIDGCEQRVVVDNPKHWANSLKSGWGLEENNKHQNDGL